MTTETPATAESSPRSWRRGVRRFGLRFACAYLFLQTFPFPLDVIPPLGPLARALGRPWRALVPWVGRRLGVDAPFLAGRTGDTRFDYLQSLCFVVVALLAAIGWAVVDRKRRREDAAADLLRAYVRYCLAWTMLSYGMAKLFDVQFPPPSPERLAERFGDASPMGLLWTFMGASRPYVRLIGCVELAGAALSFFRRTATLGALLLTPVLANVVALNFCYDVPVKLISLNLLFMTGFVLAPDVPRLVDVLVRHRAPGRAEVRAPSGPRRAPRLTLAAQLAFFAWAVYATASGARATARAVGRQGAPVDADWPLLRRGFHWVNDYPFLR